MGLKSKISKCTIFLSFFLFVTGIAVNSQSYLQNPKYGETEEARKECAGNLSTMTEFVKINMYDYAFDSWKKCYTNCPGSNKNIYIYGARILKNKIEKAADKETADRFLDTLMQMYDTRMKHFGQEDYVMGLKGIDMLKYKPDSIQRGYDYLKKSLELGKARSEEAVCITFLQASNILYRSNQKPASEFISDYVYVSEFLNQKLKVNETNDVKAAITNIETIFAESGAADCEALITIFTPKYEQTPSDLALLKNITDLMGKTGCEEHELFIKASEDLYKLEPSAKAAYNIGKVLEGKGEYEKAKDYYAEAAKQETAVDDKSYYLYKIASVNYTQGNYQEARASALSALGVKPNFGDAYLLIGSAYAASSASCGADQFERSAVYWAAVDKFNKAKAVDPSVTDRANEQIERYTAAFPNKEESFFRGLSDGQEYTVGCWINERTIVRTRKN
ncbi:MAG: tetratricopeptide repeat protein [Bacteroidales bacterium]|nr:tetratricopeptide repeat protein [Bacteroidales bacterium]